MGTETHTLVIGDYPQLKLIAWNRREDDRIAEEEAFALYEANWRFIDEGTLDAHERAFIDYLTRQYGKGVLHV
jgi:hypothetical protein